jgi:thioredoxin 1
MEITEKKLLEKIENEEKIIVDIWAEWCGPCRIMKPVFDMVSEKNETEVQMYTMNIDGNEKISETYNVRSIPTILSFNKGKLVNRSVGLLSENQIKSLISLIEG